MYWCHWINLDSSSRHISANRYTIFNVKGSSSRSLFSYIIHVAIGDNLKTKLEAAVEIDPGDKFIIKNNLVRDC